MAGRNRHRMYTQKNPHAFDSKTRGTFADLELLPLKPHLWSEGYAQIVMATVLEKDVVTNFCA